MSIYDCPTCGKERERFVPVCQERDRLRRELAAMTVENESLRFELALPVPGGAADVMIIAPTDPAAS